MAILDGGSVAQIRFTKKKNEEWLKYQWEHYAELARQRHHVNEELKKALLKGSTPNFIFKRWQRTVKYKYSLHPLSALGSLENIGGRFNVGKDVNPQAQYYAALYLAADKDTSLQEVFGRSQHEELSSREYALSSLESETTVSISGELECVFDLRNKDHLEGFVDLIKHFRLSNTLRNKARNLGINVPILIKDTAKLREELLVSNWRYMPEQADIPANSQIFGHLAFQAGIEGIVYPSNLTGKDCLAIFPQNFKMSSSYIKLNDDTPHPKTPKRIDTTNWRMCELGFNEIQNS